MTMTILPNLPEEIMLEIFSRTPAKSVGRFKCLSKLWLANLSTCEFINLHLTHQQEENLLFVSLDRKLHSIALTITDEAVSTELPGLPGNWKWMFGSCNGLVFLLDFENALFLVNPVTQQQVRVPNPPLSSEIIEMEQKYSSVPISFGEMYGFGYDISKDDYKILIITKIFYCPESKSFKRFAFVYSLKMGVWKSLPYEYGLRHIGGMVITGAHVNGVIHWLSTDPYMMLSTFNLADGVFGVIPLPDNNHIYCFRLAYVLRGCLIMVGKSESSGELKACIMKEYGVHESWTNITINIRGWRSIYIEPLCSIGENVVMMSPCGLLLLSNLETQETKTVVVNGAQSYFHDGRLFIESLVSPSSFTLVADEKNYGTDFANNTLEAGPSQAPRGSSGWYHQIVTTTGQVLSYILCTTKKLANRFAS